MKSEHKERLYQLSHEYIGVSPLLFGYYFIQDKYIKAGFEPEMAGELAMGELELKVEE